VFDFRLRTFDHPDRVVEFPLLSVQFVELGDFTIAHVVHEPGWRWSEHVRPVVGGQWCQARHIGVVVSGRGGILLADGTTLEIAARSAVDLPPGHDGWVIGEEPLVMVEISGTTTFVGGDSRPPALSTLLFTDIVDSTRTAARLGDRAWRELLSAHFQRTLAALDRHGGRRVATTGDGLLAEFDGPAGALAAAREIRDTALRQGLHVRAGVHVGEVERVGDDVRGVAVHEAARVMGAAAADEVLVTETTRALASSLAFEDRGEHALKGLDAPRRLYALTSAGEAPQARS
jgi:class 3 adenylate cyclase